MKDALKLFLILVFGLLVAAFLYPFLHETGHIIASIIVGAEVMELALLPAPSVLCDVKGVGDIGLVVIGFGGVIVPILISCFIPRKWFLSWYLRVLLQGISILALLVSCVSVLFTVNSQDDMIQVLKYWKYGEPMLLLVLIFITTALATMICVDRPIRRICDFFGV